MTTAGAMDGKPLSVEDAWRVHDRLFQDDRVAFIPEPLESDAHFREYAAARTASPKMWADAWLLAFPERPVEFWSRSTGHSRRVVLIAPFGSGEKRLLHGIFIQSSE